MFARVSRYKETTNDFDEALRIAEEKLVPQVQAVPGFLGMQFLLDRESGRSMSITYWESQQAMRDSEAEANRIREESGRLTGASTLDVERYEVAARVDI